MIAIDRIDLSRKFKLLDSAVVSLSGGISVIKDILAGIVALDQLLHNTIPKLFYPLWNAHQQLGPEIAIGAAGVYLGLLVLTYAMPKIGLRMLRKEAIRLLQTTNPGAFRDLIRRDRSEMHHELVAIMQRAGIKSADKLATQIVSETSAK